MPKRPSFQFYPGDWLRDTALRSCSVGARGLWIDMLCFMHEGRPYGHLKVNDKVIDAVTLSRMVGANPKEANAFLNELSTAGVFSQDESGAFVSKRMIEDERIREARAAGGVLGGNPKLVGEYNKPGFIYVVKRASDGALKIGISVNPSKRLYKIRKQCPGEILELEDKVEVGDMGVEEKLIHSLLSRYQIAGEWFLLDAAGENRLTTHLAMKVKVKPNLRPTPSSSSASSSSSSASSSSCFACI